MVACNYVLELVQRITSPKLTPRFINKQPSIALPALFTSLSALVSRVIVGLVRSCVLDPGLGK